MTLMRRRFAVLACAVGALTLAIGIGVASGKKLKTASDSTTLSFEEPGTATAQCPQGTKAISGGFEGETGADLGDSWVTPYASHRDGGRKWSSSGINFEDPGDIISFAYCRDAKVKTVTESSEVPPDEQSFTASATCPQGTKAISGGFDNPDFDLAGGSALFPTASHKSGKSSWTVTVTNLGNEGTLEVSVNCRKGKGLKTAKDETFVTEPLFHSATAKCKRKQRVISGGFDWSLVAGVEFSGIFESKRLSNREWTVSAFDNVADATLTAFAYCEKKKKRKK